MKNIIKLNHQYRANVVAQAVCFIINCIIYTITDNPLYVWVCISTITFIGVISSQPKNKFWDINLIHHMLFVLAFYLLSILTFNIHIMNFILIVGFTYIFFILKDSGYDKSLTLWTLVQAIMFTSTTNQLPLINKIFGTGLAFLEAQFIVFICFLIFPSRIEYVPEPKVIDIIKMSLQEWLHPKYEKVRLAIRGTVVAAILYIICIYFVSNDIRPNWAIITAIGALLRDDDSASWQTIISVIIGSIFGFTMAYIIIKLNIYIHSLTPIILWLSLLSALILMFEYAITKAYLPQILGISFTIVATVSSFIILDFNGKFYLYLRLINNMLGITCTFFALCLWLVMKKFIKHKLYT